MYIEQRDRDRNPSFSHRSREQRDTGIKDHAVAEHPRESSSESADQVVVNYRNGAGPAITL